MIKRIVLGTVAGFVTWVVLDFVIHGVLLRGSYEATAGLWRPMDQMKPLVMSMAVLISASCFTAVYGWMIGSKGIGTALKYSLLWGIAAGVSFGYGSYPVMPVPYWTAFTWFAGTVFEAVVAGLLVAAIVREPPG